MNREKLYEFYEKNMYGTWRSGETVCFTLLGEDPKAKDTSDAPRNPFEAVGGELVRLDLTIGGRNSAFLFHAYLPSAEARRRFPEGSPFLICMHPLMPMEYFLSKGYALLVMETGKIASDDTSHTGAFYDLYPYTADEAEQTGVLMAWAWGASKVLDAVISGLDREFSLDPKAAMVTGVSRYGKATAVCGAFDERFRMTIPACSGAGGLALYNVFSEGKTYDLGKVGGPESYTYGQNEPLSCLQSDAERGWFNDRFLQYAAPFDIPLDQENLPVLAMDKDRYYFIIAACMGEDWVNAPSMWECYKRADRVYEQEGLSDHLVVHFHKEGHAVLTEDAERIVSYFDHMVYGAVSGFSLEELKTSVFEGQA